MLVKICGLRTAEHALVAAAAGADLLGLVFAPSRRQVSLAEAGGIIAAVRSIPPPHPRIVGLFVNEHPTTISAIATQLRLDLVQLSGDEPVSDAEALAWPLIRSVRLDGSANETAWLAQVRAGPRELIFLADAHVPGSYGGTGVQADWERAAALAARVPLLLAGGLSAANVGAAIAKVRPLGVDVSSGVEHEGQKDSARIKAFIAAARG